MATQGIGNATPEQNKKFDANFDGEFSFANLIKKELGANSSRGHGE